MLLQIWDDEACWRIKPWDFKTPVICLELEWPAVLPLCRHWSNSSPLGTKGKHWELSFSASEKGAALWLTLSHWLVTSDTHYTVPNDCPQTMITQKTQKTLKRWDIKDVEWWSVQIKKKKKVAPLLCASIISVIPRWVIVSLSVLQPSWVSVWEMSFWQCIKV